MNVRIVEIYIYISGFIWSHDLFLLELRWNQWENSHMTKTLLAVSLDQSQIIT